MSAGVVSTFHVSSEEACRDEQDILSCEDPGPLPPLPPTLLPLTTSTPYSNIATPTVLSPSTGPPAPSTTMPSSPSLPPPLVDYLCLFSHETHPFLHTCSLDFLSPTPVLKGQMTFSLPSPSHPSLDCPVPLPDCLEHFVYPSGILLLPSPPAPMSHSFVLTLTTGDRLYGLCHTVHLPVAPSVLSVVRMQTADRMMKDPALIASGRTLPPALYAPHSLCLLTRCNFTSAYTQLLERVVGQWGLQDTVAVDVAIGLYSALCAERPRVQTPSSQSSSQQSRSLSPSSQSASQSESSTPSFPASPLSQQRPSEDGTAAGATGPSSPTQAAIPLSTAAAAVRAQACELLAMLPFVLPCWPWSQCPLIDPPSLSLLFLHLSPATVVHLLSLLLSETSVVLLSSSLHLLSPLVESLSALLHPLRWPYIYIPLLPLSLADFFQAPQPFLIGAPSSMAALLPPDASYAVVDCDRDAVRLHSLPPSPPLPYPLAWRLWQSMWALFPAYGLLHLDEPRRLVPGLPPSALCRAVVDAEGRDRRRSPQGRRGRPLWREEGSVGEGVLEARGKGALMSLRTCRILHSGSDEEGDAPPLPADEWGDDGAEEGHSAPDLSEGEEEGSALGSPALEAADGLTHSPLLPVSFPLPLQPLSAPVPAISRAASLPMGAPPPPLLHAPSAPLCPQPSPPSPPLLPASYTVSYTGEEGGVPPITPLSAYPALTASRSFGEPPQSKPRRSLNPPPVPHRTSQPPLPPSPPVHPTPPPPSPPLEEDPRWAALYNADGIVTLTPARAQRLQLAFLSVFVSLLRPYRQCIHTPPPAGFTGGVEDLFDARRFVEASHAGYQPFLQSFVDSQLMRYFLQDRPVPGVGRGATHGRGGSWGSTRVGGTQSYSLASPASSPTPPSPADTPPSPPDYFDALLLASTRRQRLRHSRHLAQPLSSPLHALGHRVPVWRQRWFELGGQGGMTLRMFSVSERMEEVERRYRALRDDYRRRRHRRLLPHPRAGDASDDTDGHDHPTTTDDATLVLIKASLDRVGEAREAMRAQLAKGSIRLEPGHTSVSIPDPPRAYPTPYAFELTVRDRRWLLCAGDEATRDQWLACIRARVGRHLEGRVGGSHPAQGAESALQLQLRRLREEQLRLFEAHIQAKVERLIGGGGGGGGGGDAGPTVASHALPLFTSAHTRRSLPSSRGSVSASPAPSPHPVGGAAGLPAAPSRSTLSRALLCAELMLRHLDIRERQWRLRSYANCFVGAECAQWMQAAGLVRDAREAAEVGTVLIGYRVIQHVAGHFVFKADDSLYQFVLHKAEVGTAGEGGSPAAASLPASLVVTPAHGGWMGGRGGRGGHGVSFTRPSAEDALILRAMRGGAAHPHAPGGAVAHAARGDVEGAGGAGLVGGCRGDEGGGGGVEVDEEDGPHGGGGGGGWRERLQGRRSGAVPIQEEGEGRHQGEGEEQAGGGGTGGEGGRGGRGGSGGRGGDERGG